MSLMVTGSTNDKVLGWATTFALVSLLTLSHWCTLVESMRWNMDSIDHSRNDFHSVSTTQLTTIVQPSLQFSIFGVNHFGYAKLSTTGNRQNSAIKRPALFYPSRLWTSDIVCSNVCGSCWASEVVVVNVKFTGYCCGCEGILDGSVNRCRLGLIVDLGLQFVLLGRPDPSKRRSRR